jgi:selenocysteine-specific translation elongation factor
MTTGVTIAVVGSPEVAKELGKKGTASDVSMFNTVLEGHAITLVEPTQFPDKLAPLLVALGMSDHCLLVANELSKAIGETIAIVDLSDRPTTVVLGPGVGEAEMARVLKGSRLESAPRSPLDYPHLRAMMEEWTAPVVEGPVEVPIDHAFPVKGVGSVALGVVRRGTLHAHDKLWLYPAGKEIEVRSLQVHDVDRKEASCGERVGVALKGIDADELSRGQVLAPPGTLSEGTTVSGDAYVRCRYYRGDAGPGAQVHLAVGLQVVPAEIVELGPGKAQVTADRPVAYRPGLPAFLLDLSVPAGPRILGRFTVR